MARFSRARRKRQPPAGRFAGRRLGFGSPSRVRWGARWGFVVVARHAPNLTSRGVTLLSPASAESLLLQLSTASAACWMAPVLRGAPRQKPAGPRNPRAAPWLVSAALPPARGGRCRLGRWATRCVVPWRIFSLALAQNWQNQKWGLQISARPISLDVGGADTALGSTYDDGGVQQRWTTEAATARREDPKRERAPQEARCCASEPARRPRAHLPVRKHRGQSGVWRCRCLCASRRAAR